MIKLLRYGFGYIAVILVFAAIYILIPAANWGESSVKMADYWDALYFSVVTITTLGFGDIVPQGCPAKVITCIEVLIGIVLIGLLLNELSMKQAEKVNKDSKERQDKAHREEAVAKILRQIPLIQPKIRSFLLECFEVVTPIDRRDFPDNIEDHNFEWTFNDIQDLFSPTLLLTNPFGSSAIENYFRSEHDLCEELRHINDNTEIQIYPELQELVYSFITESSNFTFEPAILSTNTQFMGTGAERKPLTDLAKEMISQHRGEIKYQESNLANQYVALYYHLKQLIPLAQKLSKTLAQIQDCVRP